MRIPVYVLAAALVFSSAGGAVAGSQITGKQIKNGSITGKDVKDGSLGPADLVGGAATGATGPTGPTGPAGQTGPRGPGAVRLVFDSTTSRSGTVLATVGPLTYLGSCTVTSTSTSVDLQVVVPQAFPVAANGVSFFESSATPAYTDSTFFAGSTVGLLPSTSTGATSITTAPALWLTYPGGYQQLSVLARTSHLGRGCHLEGTVTPAS